MEQSSYETIFIQDGSSSSIGSAASSIVSIQYDNDEQVQQQQQVQHHYQYNDDEMTITEIEDVRESNRNLHQKEDMEAKLVYYYEQGKLNHEQHAYDNALYMYNQALELAQQLQQQKRKQTSMYDKYEEDIIKINYQVGWLHYEHGHGDQRWCQALEYFVKCWNMINTRRKRRDEERNRMAASNASKGKPSPIRRKQSSISRDHNEQLLLEDDIYDVLEDMKYTQEQIKLFFTKLRRHGETNKNTIMKFFDKRQDVEDKPSQPKQQEGSSSIVPTTTTNEQRHKEVVLVPATEKHQQDDDNKTTISTSTITTATLSSSSASTSSTIPTNPMKYPSSNQSRFCSLLMLPIIKPTIE